MMDLWTAMAKDAGFDGLTYFYQSAMSCFDPSWDRSRFDYEIQFQPGYVGWAERGGLSNTLRWQLIKWGRPLKKLLGIRRTGEKKSDEMVHHVNYDEVWEKILKLKPTSNKSIPCAFVEWDNTPRRPWGGAVYDGASPDKFRNYFRRLVENTQNIYHQDKIFVFAWNEWAEGGYLEPDEKYKYGYLEAIRDGLSGINNE